MRGNDGIESKKDGAQVSNMAAETILVSENYGIESKRDGVTETVQWDKVGNYPSYTVGEIMDYLTLIALR